MEVLEGERKASGDSVSSFVLSGVSWSGCAVRGLLVFNKDSIIKRKRRPRTDQLLSARQDEDRTNEPFRDMGSPTMLADVSKS
jgi:hypothetical protein